MALHFSRLSFKEVSNVECDLCSLSTLRCSPVLICSVTLTPISYPPAFAVKLFHSEPVDWPINQKKKKKNGELAGFITCIKLLYWISLMYSPPMECQYICTLYLNYIRAISALPTIVLYSMHALLLRCIFLPTVNDISTLMQIWPISRCPCLCISRFCLPRGVELLLAQTRALHSSYWRTIVVFPCGQTFFFNDTNLKINQDRAKLTETGFSD